MKKVVCKSKAPNVKKVVGRILCLFSFDKILFKLMTGTCYWQCIKSEMSLISKLGSFHFI